MLSRLVSVSGIVLFCLQSVHGAWTDPAVLDACPGYNATNIKLSSTKLSANLVLAGTACNVYGNDTKTLKLEVEYETGELFVFWL